jgi:hypothetical protein
MCRTSAIGGTTSDIKKKKALCKTNKDHDDVLEKNNVITNIKNNIQI